MNGSYKPLIEYINEDSLKQIEEYEKSHKKEFEFRFKNFWDKYSDHFINDLITQIKNCDIIKIYPTEVWTLQYRILGSDIKIIDPENPDNSLEAMKIFFKRCCNILSVEFTEFDLIQQEGDELIFTVSFKNPLRARYEQNLENIMN